MTHLTDAEPIRTKTGWLIERRNGEILEYLDFWALGFIMFVPDRDDARLFYSRESADEVVSHYKLRNVLVYEHTREAVKL